MEGSFAKNWSCIGTGYIGEKISTTILEEEIIKNNQNLKGKMCMQELMNYFLDWNNTHRACTSCHGQARQKKTDPF